MIDPKVIRAAAKAKAHRLAHGDSKKVDASTWKPCAPMNTDAKTGMQPISRQARKRGGKVEGTAAAARSDRKSRGAKLDLQEVNDFVNRDVKKANAEKFGAPHNGGFKRGGRAEGGSTDAPAPKRRLMFEDMKSKYIQNKPIGESSGLRGRPDEAPEPKREVIRRNAGSASKYISNDPIGYSSGLLGPTRRDRAAALVGYGGSEDSSSPGSPPPPPMRAEQPARSASPGEGALTGTGPARAQPQPAPRPRPSVAVKSGPTPGELEADRLMAKYNASPGEGAMTNASPARAEPEERERMKAYNTASDMGLKRGGTARKARASGGQLLNDLAASTQRSGVPTGRMGFTKKSGTPLPGSMKRGGRTGKGAATTNIVISMAPSKGAAAAPMPPMGGGAMPVPVPGPAPGPMPPMGGGLPPGVMAGPPPGAMLPRKSGGRVPHMTAGAGSGVGRLEKIA